MVQSNILKHLKLTHDTISIHYFIFIVTKKNDYQREYFSDIALLQLSYSLYLWDINISMEGFFPENSYGRASIIWA